MNFFRAICIVGGMAVTVAILYTLDITFRSVASIPARAMISMDISRLFRISAPYPVIAFLNILLPTLLILFGGLLGNLSYAILSKVLRFYTRD